MVSRQVSVSLTTHLATRGHSYLRFEWERETFSKVSLLRDQVSYLISKFNPWLFIYNFFRLMMSTTSLALYCWIWSLASSTPFSILLMQTCTTPRTSTSLSTAEVLVTTGPVGIPRWFTQVTSPHLHHRFCRPVCKLQFLFSGKENSRRHLWYNWSRGRWQRQSGGKFDAF